MKTTALLKRVFFPLLVFTALALIAAQCGPAPTPETITVVETVIVEKEGEKVVETVEVVKTVEVEVEVIETVIVEVTAEAEEAAPAQADDETWDDEPIELHVMSATILEPGMDTCNETYMQEFMELHPNITVKYEGVPSENFHQKVVTLGTADSLPDVIEDQNVFVSANAEAGFTKPLNDFADDAFFDEFLPGSINMLSWDGNVYALQIGMVNTGIIYRLDMLEAAGLEEPPMNWSWEEFEDYAVALTSGDTYGTAIRGDANRGLFWTLASYVESNGGHIIEPTADGKWISKANSPEGVEALAFMSKLVNEDGVAPPNFMTNGFMESVRDVALGRSVFFETASHAFGIIAADYPELVDQLRSRPFPGDQIVSRGWAAGWSVCNTGDPVKERAAWEYVKFMTNKENQILWNDITWWMPTRKDAYDSPKLSAPQYEGFNEAAKHILDYPILPIQAKMEDMAIDTVQAIYTGNTDYQALMDAYAAGINAELEAYDLLGQE